jgi:putative phage-type endonuclease
MDAAISLLDYGDRDRWLASRSNAIGASEVAGIFVDAAGESLSPYTTPFKLFLEKTGQLPPEELNGEWIRWGNRLEPAIAAEYQDVTGRELWQGGPFCVAQHPAIEAFRSTPDRWVVKAPDRAGRGIVQLKNAGAFFGRNWSDGVPLHIEIQCQAELATTGYDWDSVAVLIGGNAFKYFDLERNDAFIAEMEDRVRWFWDLVQRREPPPIDGSARTLDAIKRLHPKDNGETVRLPEEALVWFAAMHDAKEDAKRAEAAADWAEAKLRHAIGAATFGELADGRKLSLKTTDNKGSTTVIEPYSYRTLRLEKKPSKGKATT